MELRPDFFLIWFAFFATTVQQPVAVFALMMFPGSSCGSTTNYDPLNPRLVPPLVFLLFFRCTYDRLAIIPFRHFAGVYRLFVFIHHTHVCTFDCVAHGIDVTGAMEAWVVVFDFAQGHEREGSQFQRKHHLPVVVARYVVDCHRARSSLGTLHRFGNNPRSHYRRAINIKCRSTGACFYLVQRLPYHSQKVRLLHPLPTWRHHCSFVSSV